MEEAIARHYARRLNIGEDFTRELKVRLGEALAEHQQLTQELHNRLRAHLTKLETREERLIDLAADGQLSRSKIPERTNAIRTERARIETQLAGTASQLELGAQRLTECLDRARNAAQLYARSPTTPAGSSTRASTNASTSTTMATKPR